MEQEILRNETTEQASYEHWAIGQSLPLLDEVSGKEIGSADLVSISVDGQKLLHAIALSVSDLDIAMGIMFDSMKAGWIDYETIQTYLTEMATTYQLPLAGLVDVFNNNNLITADVRLSIADGSTKNLRYSIGSSIDLNTPVGHTSPIQIEGINPDGTISTTLIKVATISDIAA